MRAKLRGRIYDESHRWMSHESHPPLGTKRLTVVSLRECLVMLVVQYCTPHTQTVTQIQ